MEKDASQSGRDMKNEPLTRQALGRVSFMGSLYNVLNDSFVPGIRLFYSDKAVTKLNGEEYHVEYSSEDSFKSKADSLGVDSNLQISLQAGACSFELSGSAKFLSRNKESNKTASASLTVRLLTAKESVNVYSKEIMLTKGCDGGINLDVLQEGLGTHVVVGIQWGANVVVRFSTTTKSEEAAREIQGQLGVKANMAGIKMGGGGATGGRFEDKIESFFNSFQFTVDGDVQPPESLPQNMTEALEFLRQVPKLTKNVNGGKGKPIAYELYPIARLVRDSSHASAVQCVVRSLDETFTARVQEAFDELHRAKRLFSDKFAEVEILADVLDEKVRTSFLKQKEELARKEIAFKNEIKVALVDFRSGKSSEDLIGRVLDAFQKNPCSEKNVREFLEKQIPKGSVIQDSINFYLLLRERGVRYLKQSETLQTELFRREGNAVYVLFIDPQMATKDLDAYLKQHQMFFNLIKEKEEASFLVLDVSLHKKVSVHKKYKKDGTSPCIICYLNGVGKEVRSDDD
ncbi:cytolytic toxin-alpha-like isoform X2 [Oscarella lobularis]|uniref:cytolytic toxin-alpha-like isoform X2 n=1 Tax=Oscarella lobularis TaxID=121494 RepID=UPI0033137C86